MANFLRTISILALVFVIGCSGKTGFEPDNFPVLIEQEGVSLKINYVENSNASHPATTIVVCVPESGRAIVTFNNATGYLIKVLLDEEVDAGCINVTLDLINEDGEIVQDGIYTVKLRFLDFVRHQILYIKF